MNGRRMISMVVVGLVLVAACAPAPSTRPASASASASAPAPAIASAAAVVASTVPSSTATLASIKLLVLGDFIAIPEMGCGACIGFDQRYATYLEGLTGRPVVLVNQARPEAQISSLQSVLDTDQVVQDAVASADVVVVSIGYNDTPPWAPDLPCHTPEPQKDADLWAGILAMTKECIAASVDIYGKQLDAAYGRIEELAGGRPQVRVALGSFNNLKDNPGGDGTIATVTADVMAAGYPIFASVMDAWNEADLRSRIGTRICLRRHLPTTHSTVQTARDRSRASSIRPISSIRRRRVRPSSPSYSSTLTCR